MTTFQTLTLPKKQLCVWAFIPYQITPQGLIGEFYENPGYRQELASVFAELGIKWKWQPITLENMQAVVEEVVASSRNYTPVVLNYCDGFDEVDGYPGLSVIKLLEEKGINFTGGDSNFEYQTISKIRMKQALVEAGVSTAPYDVISDVSKIGGICEKLGTPLIVKPAISTGGIGLSSKSVVHSDEEIFQYIQDLLDKGTESRFTLGNIFVERFIDGREFTVLMVGSAQKANQLKIYPSLELIFHSSLSKLEKIKCHKIHLENSVEGFLTGQLVTSSLSEQICDLAKRAYCAVGGNGYGRVDIRMDSTSQELFVLEVNANCAISSEPISASFKYGQTSVGTILQHAGISFAQLISEIIWGAFSRDSTNLPSVNQAA